MSLTACFAVSSPGMVYNEISTFLPLENRVSQGPWLFGEPIFLVSTANGIPFSVLFSKSKI